MALSSLWKRKLLMYVIDNGPRGEIGNGSSLMARTEGMSRAGIIERPWVACQVILRGWLNECVAVKAGGIWETECVCLWLHVISCVRTTKMIKVLNCCFLCSVLFCVTLWTNSACVFCSAFHVIRLNGSVMVLRFTPSTVTRAARDYPSQPCCRRKKPPLRLSSV